MALENTVFLIGHLGRDPEVRTVAENRNLSRFSLATNEFYKTPEGEKKEITTWHSCVAWGKTAELTGRLLTKGKKIAVHGKITYNDYTDGDGINRRVAEIVVSEFLMLDSARSSAEEDTTASNVEQA
jgi:single-strand DNA-binding protein